MKIVEAPMRPDWRYVNNIFLAGSIEMGKAENWQQEVITMFENGLTDATKGITQILNPRRKDWDSTWEQKYENPHFSQQVRWELEGLAKCNWILMYFDPKTTSPISLLELGAFKKPFGMVVVCPEGFYRKGNVDIFCDVNNITQLDTLWDAVKYIRTYLKH